MDDTTLRKPGEGGQPAAPDKKVEPAAPVQKVDNTELEQKLKETNEKQAKTDADIAQMKLDKEFEFIVQKYPHAADLKDKIYEKAKAGISIGDASVIVLNESDKLIKREDIDRDAAGMASMGGSAPTMMPGSAGQKVNDAVRKMNTPGLKITEQELGEIQSTLRDALAEEEKKGTFAWVPD